MECFYISCGELFRPAKGLKAGEDSFLAVADHLEMVMFNWDCSTSDKIMASLDGLNVK